ncbi:MAG: TonB-dependent siderophore receptor [Methylobacter sp.]
MVNNKKNFFSGEIEVNPGRKISSYLIKGMFILTICHAVPALSEADKTKINQFDMPSGDLASALNSFAEKTGMELSYPASMVAGLKSRPLKGSYKMQEGLNELLRGTGLAYRLTGENSVTLEKPPAANAANSTTLSGVTVKGQRQYDPNDPFNKDYAVPNASSATKIDTPIMETPMSIQVVPRALMQDQQAVQVGDAIKNVSGVFQGFTFGGFAEEFMIRGFNTNYANYLDGFRWPSSRLALANAERIEVVKGAAANLYGRIQPGGMINVVTKRPQATPYYSLEQRFGSYDLYQTLGDATGAINKDGSLMYRLNLEYLSKNSFRDFAYTDRVFVAPSLTWKVNDRTQLDLDFMYSNENTLEDHGVVASSVTRRPVDIPISTFLGEPSTDKSNTTFYNTALTLNHAFTDNWKINARFNYLNRETRDLQTAAPGALNLTTGSLTRNFFGGDGEGDSYGGTVNLNGKFSTWNIKHDVLGGWDYYSLDGTAASWQQRPVSAGGIINPINIYNPVYGQSGMNLAATPKSSFQVTSIYWNGVYFQDQITLFDKLHVLGGGRYDWAYQASGLVTGANKSLSDASANLSGVDNQRFSPRVGLLYQPWAWLSLYGNYVESLGGANTAIGVGGSVLQPETAEQYEAGFKTEFFDKRLISSVAFYQLTKQNMSASIVGTPYSQAIGEARSQGVEMDVTGRVTDGLSLIATYAYTDASILKGTNAGNKLWNVPRNAGSFWAKYDLQQAAVRGLSVGAGVYFQGQREGDSANSFELPGYGRVDALVKYQLPVAKARTTLQFNVENLLDHRYYASTGNSNTFINPGSPRTFMGSVKVEF